jgi:hypothetical protein
MTEVPLRDPETGQFVSANSGRGQMQANEQFNEGLRLGLAARLGTLHSFGDDNELRDHYDTFGWPKDPDDEDYLALYLRNAFARVVVDKPAFTTWRVEPAIHDVDQDGERNEDSDFETDIQKLFRGHDLRSYFERVDRVAGVGEHGALAISFADVSGDMEAWERDAREADLTSLDDINTLKPLLQTQIDDIGWGGPDSERWGKPEYYSVDWSDDIDAGAGGERGPLKIHWTRIIDIPATRLLDDETLARPRVEPVLNNLLDIEKTLGSSAELSYRGADYGLHLNFDPAEVDVTQLDTDEMRDEFQRWYHGLQPEFKTVGAELSALGGDTIDPSPIVDNNLKAIYAQTGIPKREFIGNQQGEQSGAEQDEKSYFGTIAERQDHYATPYIVRRTIDRFRTVGILPDLSGVMYEVNWPDLAELSELEQSEIAYNRARAAKNVAPQGNTDLLPGGLESALEYLDTGEFPDDAGGVDAMNVLDESDEAVQEQFEALAGDDG